MIVALNVVLKKEEKLTGRLRAVEVNLKLRSN